MFRQFVTLIIDLKFALRFTQLLVLFLLIVKELVVLLILAILVWLVLLMVWLILCQEFVLHLEELTVMRITDLRFVLWSTTLCALIELIAEETIALELLEMLVQLAVMLELIIGPLVNVKILRDLYFSRLVICL